MTAFETSPPERAHRRSIIAFVLAVVLAQGSVAVSPAQASASAFPGGNGLIAYASNAHAPGTTPDGLYTINPDGSGRAQIGSGGFLEHPAWSADGQRLAFEADQGIWVAAADGSGAQRIAEGRHPSWSPDGSALVFVATVDEMEAIFRVNADGSGLARVSPEGTTAPTAEDPEGGDIARFLQPSWSPDGSRIAVNRRFCTFNFSAGFGCTYRPQLAVMNADGSGLTVLHEVVQGEEEGGATEDHIGGPDWSPDGASIAFHRRVVEEVDGTYFRTFDLMVIGAGGGEPANLTQTGDLEAETWPAWSPDGASIAYTHNPGGTSNDDEIFVLPAAGGAPSNVTNDPGPSFNNYVADRHPSWQPLGGAEPGPGPGPAPEPEPEPEPEPNPDPEPNPEPEPGPGGARGFDGDAATTERTAGGEPTAVAVGISQTRFADAGGAAAAAKVGVGGQPADQRPAEHAVLSRDDAFPDSLAGSPLTADGPLLVTATASLTPATRSEIQRVLAPGSTVYLLGGVAAISQAVEDELTRLGYQPRRLFGASRIETAVAVADEVRRLFPNSTEVAVARAFPNDTAGWADSVTGGGWAASQGVPILVTGTEELAPQAAAWLQRNGPSRTVLLGGFAALSQAVEDAVPAAFRVFGAERTETAAQISTQLWGVDATGPRTYVVTNLFDPSGWVYGLSAGGLAADAGAPLLGVGDDVPAATAELIASCGSPQIETLLVGGAGIVSDTVLAELDRLDGNDC